MNTIYPSWAALVEAEVKSAIAADREKTVRRLRQMNEEKARFACDVLQNEWFFGEDNVCK